MERLRDASPIQIYLSGSDGARISWPWRMQPAHDCSMGVRQAGEYYIVDSSPQKPEIKTSDVLDEALRLNADAASLEDVYQDYSGTVDSLLRGLEVADSHAFDGRLLLPLQAPHAKMYQEIGSPKKHMIGIGGLKNQSAGARIAAAKSVRDIAPNVHLHGLGWGIYGGLASEIRRNPSLIDSTDYSTPMRRGIGRPMTPGKEVTSVQAAFAGYQLIRDLREVTDLVDSKDGNISQKALNDYG